MVPTATRMRAKTGEPRRRVKSLMVAEDMMAKRLGVVAIEAEWGVG